MDKGSSTSPRVKLLSQCAQTLTETTSFQPEKVASILVVDMSPVSNADEFLKLYPRLMQAMKTVDFRGTKLVSHGCRVARSQLKHIVPDVQTRELVLSNVKVKRDGTIGWACNLDILIRHFEYMSEIPDYYLRKQYPGPALFIGGQVSEYMPYVHSILGMF